MTVVLVSDATVTSRGFRARWSSDQEAVCGGQLTGSSGVVSPPVTSPGGNYTDHTWCLWTHVLESPANSTLVLSTPEYHLEAAYNDLYCRYDWVQVWGRAGGGGAVAHPPQCGKSSQGFTVASPLPESRILFRYPHQASTNCKLTVSIISDLTEASMIAGLTSRTLCPRAGAWCRAPWPPSPPPTSPPTTLTASTASGC